MAVDTANHVITDIQAYHADGKDNQQLQDISNRLRTRLWREGLYWQRIPADTGYSSGENYAYLEEKGIESYIPPHGTYKGGPEGFIYHEEGDYFTCPKGKTIPYTKDFLDHRTQTRKKEYRASKKICKGCPIRSECLGKTVQEKRISLTAYRAGYERNNARVRSKEGQYLKHKRSSTVEPVFGTLTQYMGMRKVNTKGLSNANKVMHMAATAYNLKKLLKTIIKRAESGQQYGQITHAIKNTLQTLESFVLSYLNFFPRITI